MLRELFSPITSNGQTIPEPVELGGTGATTPQGACLNLNMLSNSELGQTSVAAQLDTQGLVKPENIPELDIVPLTTLDGNTVVYTDQVCKFLITNYDSLRTYQLSAISGSVSLVSYENFNTCMLANGGADNSELPGNITACDPPGTILFTAPSVAGPSGFILNDVTYNFNVQQAYVAKPTLLTPDSNVVWNTRTLSTLVQEPFVLGHQNSLFTWSLEFQLAEDNAFTANLQTSNTNNLNTTFNNLSPNKLYYIRVRAQVDGIYPFSEWSNTVSFVTNSKLYSTNEIQIIVPSNAASNEGFGSRMALSHDGQLLVVGCANETYGDPNKGRNTIFIYEKVNNLFEMFSAINFGGPQYVSYGFRQILISLDKTTIAFVGSSGPNDNLNYLNLIETLYVYKRVNDWWELAASTILPSTGDYSGYQISANDDLSKITAVQQTMSINPVPFLGLRVFVFSFNGNALNQTATINPTSQNVADYTGFGSYSTPTVMNAAGNRIAIGYLADGSNQMGCVFIYDYDGADWNQTFVIHSDLPSPIANTYFGADIYLSKDGDTLFVSGMYDNISRIFVFKFINNNWVKQIDFIPNGWNASMGNMERVCSIPDGSSFLIPTRSTVINANSDGSGYVELFENNSSTVSLLHKYDASDDAADSFYGTVVAMSDNLATIAISAPNKNVYGRENEGCVYIYG